MDNEIQQYEEELFNNKKTAKAVLLDIGSSVIFGILESEKVIPILENLPNEIKKPVKIGYIFGALPVAFVLKSFLIQKVLGTRITPEKTLAMALASAVSLDLGSDYTTAIRNNYTLQRNWLEWLVPQLKWFGERLGPTFRYNYIWSSGSLLLALKNQIEKRLMPLPFYQKFLNALSGIGKPGMMMKLPLTSYENNNKNSIYSNSGPDSFKPHIDRFKEAGCFVMHPFIPIRYGRLPNGQIRGNGQYNMYMNYERLISK